MWMLPLFTCVPWRGAKGACKGSSTALAAHMLWPIVGACWLTLRSAPCSSDRTHMYVVDSASLVARICVCMAGALLNL
jgi:hypothetical protein